METLETQNSEVELPRANTAVVLVLLAIVAMIFSYLAAYAMANALVSAEVIAPWPSDRDPRLRWFGNAFVVFMGSFLMIGGVARFLSWRQLRRIDQMEDADVA